MIHIDFIEQGEGDRPLVILHGLFGSARNWGAIQKALARSRPVFALDARNHGRSAWTEGMTYDDMAEDLLNFLAEQGLAGCDVMGHSMGGKASMVAALTEPAMIGRLMVVDIAPVRYRHSFGDYIQAMRDLDLSGITRRAEVAEALAPVVEDAGIRQFLLQNLVPAKSGEGYAWQLNLATLGASMDDISAFPDLTGRTFEEPTRFLAGELSDYITFDRWDRVAKLFPKADHHEIPGVGHWPHAEKPKEFIQEVEAFFSL
ncbi:MAG: alpha/beta fold hydrolase [Magnetovibrionaceae bacterium]